MSLSQRNLSIKPMKCTTCQKDTINLIAKFPLIFGIGMKCRNCGARYKRARHFKNKGIILIFLSWLFELLLSVLWLPLFIFSIWAVYTLSWWAPTIALVALVIFTTFVPYEIDKSDPTNKIIERVIKHDNNT